MSTRRLAVAAMLAALAGPAGVACGGGSGSPLSSSPGGGDRHTTTTTTRVQVIEIEGNRVVVKEV